MQEIMKTKLLPILILVLILGLLMLAAPVTASAEEPLEENEVLDEYTEMQPDGYEETEPDEDIIELPGEYYPSADPAFTDGDNPFAPEGTGTVINNATDGDGKEFYTIETPDGNVFYLVIDRQRSTDNVYFLGAVTEEDLMSLAQIEKKPESTATAFTDDIDADEETAEGEITEPKTEPVPASPPSKDDLMLYIIIGVAIIGVGGAGYYLKIVKPKKDGTAAYDDDYGEDYEDDDDNNSYGNNNDDNGDQYYDKEDDYYDENVYEDETDMDFDDGDAPDAPDSNYGNNNAAQQRNIGTSPSSQGNRSSRRRRRKRRRPNNSGG